MPLGCWADAPPPGPTGPLTACGHSVPAPGGCCPARSLCGFASPGSSTGGPLAHGPWGLGVWATFQAPASRGTCQGLSPARRGDLPPCLPPVVRRRPLEPLPPSDLVSSSAANVFMGQREPLLAALQDRCPAATLLGPKVTLSLTF